MTAQRSQIFTPTRHRANSARRRPLSLLDAIIGTIVVLTIFGYPMVATLPIFLSLDTQIVSLPYRALMVALAFAAMFLAGLERRRTAIPLYVQVLLGTSLVLLTLRFVNDALALGLPPHPVQTAGEFALFFYGVTLLPALALVVPLRADFTPKVYGALVAFGAAAVGLAVLAINVGAPELEPTARAGGEGLNAITYASIGALLVLLMWSLPETSHPRVSWLLRGGGIALGLVPLVSSASRGPIISLLIVLATCHVVTSKAPRWQTMLALAAVAAVLMVAGREWADSVGDDDDAITIARRFSNVADDQSTVERLIILNSSWDVFTANPLLGGAIVEPVLKAYPHNILLESLMVGGVPFGLVMLALVIATAAQAIRLIGGDSSAPLHRFIGMFTLFTLVMSMLSGSLYRGPDLWAAVALSFSFGLARPTGRRVPGKNRGTVGAVATPRKQTAVRTTE